MKGTTFVLRWVSALPLVLHLLSPAPAGAQLQIYWCSDTAARLQGRCLAAQFIDAIARADKAPDLAAPLAKWTKTLGPSAATDVVYATSAREKIFRESANAISATTSGDSTDSALAVLATKLALATLADVEAGFHRMFVKVLDGQMPLPGVQADSAAKWQLRREDATRLIISAAGAIQSVLVSQPKAGGRLEMLKLNQGQRDSLAAFVRFSFPGIKPAGSVSSDLRYGPQMILKLAASKTWKSSPK